MKQKEKNSDCGFKSRPGHTETRTNSGFQTDKAKSGQRAGQDERSTAGQLNIVQQIIQEVMKETNIAPLPYKDPFVYEGKNDYFLDFSYWKLNEGKYHRDKIRINERHLTRDQKVKLLHEVCRRLKPELKRRNDAYIYHETIIAPHKTQAQFSTIIDWLDFAILDNEKILPVSADRKQTYSDLKSNLQRFYEEKPEFAFTTVETLNKAFTSQFVVYLQGLGRAGKTVNKYLGALQALTEWLNAREYTKIIFSTEAYRVEQPKNETSRYPPLTNDELIRVFEYYYNWQGGHFYLFLLHHYYSCIRPGELHRLQRKDYDFKNKQVFVNWLDAKNGLSNWVQLLDPLYDALMGMGIDKLAPDTYIFGTSCLPSAEPYVGHYTSNTWAEHRERVGIDKKKQLYGMKHTFNRNFVEMCKREGKPVDWEWLRVHNRHQTVQQTQAYIRELTAFFLDENQYPITNYAILPGKAVFSIGEQPGTSRIQ